MTAPILAAAVFCFTVTAFHVASIAIAMVRLRPRPHRNKPSKDDPAVSLVRPLCGLDNYAEATLASTFTLDYPHCQILFCVAAANDPVVPLVETLMAKHLGTDAKLMVGDERISSNPKLNNVLKGWRAAAHDWIILADSNVLMPPDYVEVLFASWRAGTGLVASPPIGSHPRGIWAELECAFLNTYQARWQYVAEALGFGFAQGKTMLWRRADLERAGGIEALANEVAEDAAATKIVRGAGLKVRLADRPFAQPLGRRSASEVWGRQIRWARLRRASFLLYFLPEVLSGGVLAIIAAAIVACGVGLPTALSAAVFALVWYGAEMLLAADAGWHLSLLAPLYGFARDLLIPVIFVNAMRGNDFVWRGNDMQVERLRPPITISRLRAHAVIARVRPRLGEIARSSRRHLRALRTRAS